MTYALGVSFQEPFGTRYALFGGVNWEEMENDDYEEYGIGQLSGHLGCVIARAAITIA